MNDKNVKILLIYPGIKENEFTKVAIQINRYRIHFPTLGLPLLAALVPQDIEIKIIDEVHGLIKNFEEADLVGISGMTMHANRMYEIADIYRSKGTIVILGGVHVSSMPTEAAMHADSIVIGEAESIWPKIIEDFKSGKLESVYQAQENPSLENLPFPRLDLIDGPAYRPPRGYLNTSMATRGCPYNCTFCCVTKMFGRKFRVRPVENVIAEISLLPYGPLYFNDDNLTGNANYAMKLFDALKSYNFKWGTQVSINIADNAELLKLASDCGCVNILIGFESVNPKSITFLNKNINKVEKYFESIKKIKDYGIAITGSFIVGLDEDDESVFDQIYNFVEETEIENPIVGILTPYPGTDVYKQYLAENRIFDQDWSKYNFNNVVFKPRNMSVDKLQYKYNELVQTLLRYEFRNRQYKIYT